MNNKKKCLQGILCAAFVCTALFGLAACGTSVTAVSVGRNDMPRLTYVEGQELDLSTGALTVEYSNGTVETIPFGSEGVSVSGYDKNSTGEQTVTITYAQQTTTISVTVIPRIEVVNAQTVYYVGETFDTSRGSLIVANDDASTNSVLFSDASVSFSGFDSSAPVSSQTITVTYEGAQTYTGEFEIAVYTTDNATLTPPNRTNYQSHESFQVNGAYITYSNGNHTYDKNIPVTQDMVSGLDFSKVTAENSPMTQTAIVSYGGKTYSFEVTITYSEVTELQKMLKEGAFEWTEPTVPTVDSEKGESAMACVEKYLTLSSSQRSYIDRTQLENAVRTAAAYGYQAWRADLAACEETFDIADGELRWYLSSYAAAEADRSVVTDDTRAVNTYVDFLTGLIDSFGSLAIGGEQMRDYLEDVSVYRENREDIADLLDFCTRLYATLAEVPADWTDATAYAQDVEAAIELLTTGKYGSSSYRNVLAQVGSWREKKDFYDIVYSYCLDTEDTAALSALKECVLPAGLEELYLNLAYGINEYMAIYIGSDGGVSTDSTFFMYYYREARALADAIAAGENELHKELYATLTFDDFLMDNTGQMLSASFDDLFAFLETTEFGYYDLFGLVLDDEELVAMWDTYLAMLDIVTQEDAGEAASAFLEQFVTLTPGQQKSFLYSVNVYYASYDRLALDLDLSYTYLVRILNAYYSETLSDTEFSALRQLLLAVESYASISENESALEDFLFYFSAVKELYDGMQDTTAFRAQFGAIYDMYAAIAARYNADGTLAEPFEVEKEWQDVLDAYAQAVGNVLLADSLIHSEDEATAQNAYLRLFAAYEEAIRYEARIASAPDNVKEAYSGAFYTFFGEYNWTLDYAMSVQGRLAGMDAYTSLFYGNLPLWEAVRTIPALGDFLAAASPVIWTQTETAEKPSTTDAVNIMKQFLTLSDEEKMLFAQLQLMEENHPYYYNGLTAIFTVHFADDTAIMAAVNALFDAEEAMISYRAAAADETLTAEELAQERQTLDEAMTALETAVSALSETQATQFNELFAEILSYYRTAYSQLPAASAQGN